MHAATRDVDEQDVSTPLLLYYGLQSHRKISISTDIRMKGERPTAASKQATGI